MCGIAGILDIGGFRNVGTHIDGFIGALTHRGPDSMGSYLTSCNKLALGHTRLSIVDLNVRSDQPFHSACGRYVIVYNGEIFNYIELRSILKSKGHVFHTTSDTEVLLNSFVEWGVECFNKFNGMWAFAIWDRRNKELTLSRDRFGIKPLYYTYEKGRVFAFASETVAFGKLDNFSKQFNERDLAEGIRNPYVLEATGRTIYKDIKSILPGTYLTITNSTPPVHYKWWRSEKNLVATARLYVDQIQEYREIFEDACKIRLRSDVPLASALSGGLDSSSIYATCRNIIDKSGGLPESLGNWAKPFTLSFPGTKWDESQAAEVVAKNSGDQLNIVTFNPATAADEIVRACKAADFLYISPPVVQKIYAEMRNCGIKVSLDGHGADEALFGYPDMIETVNRAASTFPQLDCYQKTMRLVSSKIPRTVQYSRMVMARMLPNQRRNSWLFPVANDDVDFGNPYDLGEPNYVSYHEVHSGRLPTLLRNFDHASMASGVEIRMPFMDWRLIAYSLSLPLESKYINGITKLILRDAMNGIVPDEIRGNRVKIGVNAPTDYWFSSIFSSLILDSVSSASFLQSSIWNGKAIRDFVEVRAANNSWNMYDSQRVWPFINAHLLGA